MNKSIKRFLTINTLCMVALATMLATIAAFFLRQDQIKLHLDAELSIEAHSIDSFIVKRLNQKQLLQIQKKINNIPKNKYLTKSQSAKMVNELTKNVQFQVWDLKTNQLILHSPNAPVLPLNNNLGYQSIALGHDVWSVYAIEAKQPGYKIVTMQRHEQRLGYEKQFVTDSLIIIIFTFAFLGVTLQIVIQRGLAILSSTTSQLRKNAPGNLEPLNATNTPLEVIPLVNEINRLMSQLDQTLERERQFAANAAHTLKTPLSAMKAQLQMASRLPAEAQANVFIDISLCIDRYDHIIRQLLTLSRAASENPTAALHWINISSTLQDIIAPLVPLALDRNINIELTADNLPKVLTEPSLLSTALTNLIDNAVKYTSENDTILITATVCNPYIEIQIIDHGPGIPTEEYGNVLERFQRLSATTRGSGLGLSIVDEICKNIDADLSLEKTSPTGLTITLRLPINPHPMDESL